MSKHWLVGLAQIWPTRSCATCGWLWKGCPCRPTLRSSESRSAVSGTAELTPVAGTHGNSWILPGIAESLICLPVMGMRFNYLFASFYLLKNLIKLMQMVKYLEVFLLGRVSFSSCLHSTLLWGHTCSLNSCLWCLCTERIPVSLITKLGKGKTEFSNWWHIYTRIVTL